MRRLAGPLALLLLLTVHGGCDALTPGDGVRVVWQHPAPGLFLAETRPLVEGGRAYVAFNEQFSAFDAHDGDLLWTANAHQHAGSVATDVLSDGDLLYFHYLTWVRAFRKADGRTVWSTPLDGSGGLALSQMAQTATHLFLGRRNEVVRIAKATGALDARFDLRPLVPSGIEHGASGVALSSDGATLYVSTGFYVPEAPATEGYVVAFDAATGAQRWAFPIPPGTWTPPGGEPQPTDAAANGLAVAGEAVVVTSGQGVFALDGPTGAVRWERFFEDEGFWVGPTIGDGAVFVGSTQERVFALDLATGAERWRQPVRGSVIAGPFTYHGGRLYLNVSTFGEVWVFDGRSGRVVWHGEPPADEFRSQVGVGDGRMVVVGDENVYGLSLP